LQKIALQIFMSAKLNPSETCALPKYDGLLCKAIRQELAKPSIAGAVIEFGTGDD
jgi:hypothetical protein